MTTTIPENPKPGQRFMRLDGEVNGEGRWGVYEMPPDKEPESVPWYAALHLSLRELDARLLVHGGAAVAALRELQDAYEDGTPQCFCSHSNLDFVPGPCTPCKVRNALANFPE